MLYKSSVSEREWEATILYNQNAPGAYCFPSPFHCVAIDLVYAFAVLCSALSITFPGETTTKKQGICFQSLWAHTKTKRQQHNTHHTHTDGEPVERETHFTEHLGNGNLMSMVEDKAQSHLSFLFLPPLFPAHNEKNNLEAMVVGFLNMTWCWISVVCLYYT